MRKKLIFLLLIPFLLGATYSIDDFSGGLKSHYNPYITPKNSANSLQNVRVNNKYGSLSKRLLMTQYGSIGSFSVTGLYRYYKSDATIKLIASGSTKLFTGNDSTGVFQTIKTGLTDSQRFQFATYNDLMIASNGSDAIQMYDGATDITANTDANRTADYLTADLGSCFAELNTGSNLDASKWYKWKIVFYDGSTYYYSTALSNALQMGTTVKSALLTDIPLGPSGTTNRYIYRCSGQDTAAACDTADFYLVGAMGNNTSTTANDNNSDATIEADNAPTWATASAGNDITPPTGDFIEINDGRLFVSGNSTYQSRSYYSNVDLPWYFTSSDYEDFRPDDGDKITGIKVFKGILTIFKSKSISKYFTEGSETDGDWYPSEPFEIIGCHAPYTLSVSPSGILFLNKKGLYSFDGYKARMISDVVTDKIKDIDQTNIENACGIYLNNEYQLSYTSSSGGGSINDKVLIFDFERNSYVLDTKNANCFAALDAQSDQGIVYLGSSDSDGYVYSLEEDVPQILINKKSEFDEGSYDDTRVYNTEDNPVIELAWDCTIDGWLTELQTKDASITDINSIGTYLPNAIIDRPDTDGTWTSPAYEVNAGNYVKLYWNERLGEYGNITWQVRSAATAAAITGASWSDEFTNPSGSDLSSLTANNFVQLRANLSTSDIDYSPELYLADGYVFKFIYYKAGSTKEDDVLSTWQSGWQYLNLNYKEHDTIIGKIKVYYRGTNGTLTTGFKNIEGTENTTFDIDLSLSPGITDNYKGLGNDKIYIYYPFEDTTGKMWNFNFSETGDTSWRIDKIEVVYEVVKDTSD
jgi:hypothetical protein